MGRMAFGFGVQGRSAPVLDLAYLALVQQYNNLNSPNRHGIILQVFLFISSFFCFVNVQ